MQGVVAEAEAGAEQRGGEGQPVHLEHHKRRREARLGLGQLRGVVRSVSALLGASEIRFQPVICCSERFVDSIRDNCLHQPGPEKLHTDFDFYYAQIHENLEITRIVYNCA